jgi:hypothetical protein
MKYLTTMLLILFLGTGSPLKAQGIFNQNKTMLRRCMEQIILLKTYTGYLKKGYKIVNGGLHTISGIKNGEFGLHGAYYGSLSAINPKISGYARVADILKLADQITQTCQSALQSADTSNLLSREEQQELGTMTHNLLREVQTDMNRMELLLQDDKLKMTDAERLSSIDQLWESTKQHWLAADAIGKQTTTIIQNRIRAKQNVKLLNQWYGLPGKN